MPNAGPNPSLCAARVLAMRGEDAAAKDAYLDLLHSDPTNFHALNELAALALAGSYRAAARTAWLQAVRYHPGNPVGHVNLGNLLEEDGDLDGARAHFAAALAAAPDLPEAHQGMARVLQAAGDETAAWHAHKGFSGHATVSKPYRGSLPPVRLLVLVSAFGGNIPLRSWVDDRTFAVTAITMEYWNQVEPVPPHALILNAIGDADLCGRALAAAGQLVAGSDAAVINRPEAVAATGRVANARRLGSLPGVVTPRLLSMPRDATAPPEGLTYPLLLRSPGFQTGRHFRLVERPQDFAPAKAELPGADLLAIEYLDARGRDGMARKYRVMFVGGMLLPLHLALSTDWKVHYFSAAMAANPAFRAEERAFLEDMQGVLGARAMRGLAAVAETLGLDYAGVDFALAQDGSVLLFEANATMVVGRPGPEPHWDYRRPAIDRVLAAMRELLLLRAGGVRAGGPPGSGRRCRVRPDALPVDPGSGQAAMRLERIERDLAYTDIAKTVI
jgi:hypothetical protein